MKTFVVTSNQDESTGEFSRQGARMTPANAVTVATKDHACTFGHVLTGGMVDAHMQCVVGCGLDDMQQEACKRSCLKEGTTR